MPRNLYVDTVDALTSPLLKNQSSLILKLDMELTERCNNNCIHCCINLSADHQRAREKELSTIKIKSILTEAASLGCLMVRFTGGEPLLREDFGEIYLFARKLGLVVLIFTNATLITPQLADLFSQIPPLQPIEITLYGNREKIHDEVTESPGSFEAAMSGIHLLKNRHIPFLIKSAFFSHTIAGADEFDSWAKTLTGLSQPPPSTIILDLRSRRDSARKNKQIKSLRPGIDQAVNYLTRNRDQFITEMRLFFKTISFKHSEMLFSCYAGRKTLCVDPYGKVQYCLQLRHPDIIYDLEKGSLKNAAYYFHYTIIHKKAKNSNYIRRCMNCFLKMFCEQCPAKSWSEHGVLDRPVEYLCEFTHTQAVYLGLIKKGEKAWKIKDGKNRLQHFRINTSVMKNES